MMDLDNQQPHGERPRDPELLTVSEVAKLLNCSERKLKEDLRIGLIPGVRPGVEWIIPRQALVGRLQELALHEAAKRQRQYAVATTAPLMPAKRKPGRPRLPVPSPGRSK